MRNARVSSRKAKLVIDLIRNKELDESLCYFEIHTKEGSRDTRKLLKSAEANAVNNNGLNRDNLYVAEIYATQGPTLKRIRPRAHGRAYRINKRTSHLTLVLREKA